MRENTLYSVLWTEKDVYEHRYQRTEALLIAVVRVVEKHIDEFGGQGQNFTKLYNQFIAAPILGQRIILRDPTFYYWVRIAYELLFSKLHYSPLPRLSQQHIKSLGLSDIAQSLENHLKHFGLFYLAAGVANKQIASLPSPVELLLPYAIPGSQLALSANIPVAWLGINEKSLLLEVNGEIKSLDIPAEANESKTKTVDVELHKLPIVTTLGCSIALQPYTYNLPGLDFAHLIVEAGMSYQHEHKSCIEAALRVFKHYEPQIFEQFRSVMRIIAIKPSKANSYRDNLSHSDLPGAIVIKPVYEPNYLAHVLIHEFHHNRLFFIEDGNPLLAGNDTDVESTTRCYSPWRIEPRPLHGVLHGLYVFIPVTRFWLKVFSDKTVTKQIQELAHDQVIRSLLQMKIAYRQLSLFAEFTPFGLQVFEQMKIDINHIENEITNSDIPIYARSVSGQVDEVFDYSMNLDYKDAVSVSDDVMIHLQHNASVNEAKDLKLQVMNQYL